MSRGIGTALAAVLVPWILASAASPQETSPKAIIQRAVNAAGGLEQLTRAKAGYRKVKGLFHTDKFGFTGESYGDDGNRTKIILRGLEDNPEVRVMVVEDSKGWASFNGTAFDFDEKLLARMRKGSHADKVSGLVTLLRDKGYTLTALGESKVSGAAAVGVKVQFAGMPDINLYFDNTTGFLVKTAYRLTDLDTEQEYLQEVYYSRFELIEPAAGPVKVLQTAKQATDGPALLKFLKQRTPDKEERERIDLLILELGQTAFRAREKASAALLAMGAKAAGQLRAALNNPDREIVRRAEQILEQLGNGPESNLATATLRLLAIRKPEGTAQTLLAYLPSAFDDSVAKEVLFALTAVVEGDTRARSVVEAMLKDGDPQRRSAAAAVLGQDGGVFLKQPWRPVTVVGVRMPRVAQVYRDGRPYLDIETFDQQLYNSFDDAFFARLH